MFASIISADNEAYTEDVKQEIISRYNKDNPNWEYILEPLGGDADMYIKLMKDGNSE